MFTSNSSFTPAKKKSLILIEVAVQSFTFSERFRGTGQRRLVVVNRLKSTRVVVVVELIQENKEWGKLHKTQFKCLIVFPHFFFNTVTVRNNKRNNTDCPGAEYDRKKDITSLPVVF